MTSPTDLRTRLAGALADVPRTENAPLSAEAQAYADRAFPCEPPCDSWGACSNCCERSVFWAGYNFGDRGRGARNAPLHSALADCAGALEASDCWELDRIGVLCRTKASSQCPRCAALARLGELLGEGEGK